MLAEILILGFYCSFSESDRVNFVLMIFVTQTGSFLLQALAEEFSGKVYFAKVNVDENDVSKKTSTLQQISQCLKYVIFIISFLRMFYDNTCLVIG